MSPHQVTTDLIRAFGEPNVHNLLNVPIVNFPLGRSRITLTKMFARAGCLQETKANALVNKHGMDHDNNILWDEVGEAEGLQPIVAMVPELMELTNSMRKQSRLADIAWDQAFYNSCQFALKCIKDTGAEATAYPLFEGPPGASKTQVAVTVATLAQRPVYAVIGGDGAADEIKAALLGGPYPSDKAAWAIAKENSYIGALSNPHAIRLLIDFLSKKPFDAITVDEFKKIAELEGIREGITYDKKGAYQLARENGGILLLEECNSFPAEVHSLLTQILENYLNGGTHPNFFIIATQNEAGESHPSRNPLPKEVVNRFERYRVALPSKEQYQQALYYSLFREQPVIQLTRTKKGAVTPAMIGIDTPAVKPHSLVQILTKPSVEKLAENIITFHKAIEEKIADGILDPKESQEPPTKETTFISRRNIRRLLNGLDTEIYALAEEITDEYSAVSLSTYLKKGPLKLQDSAITGTMVIAAIWEAIERYYVQPNTFPVHQKIESLSKEGNKQQRLVTSSRDIIIKLAATAKLTPDIMKSYIHTTIQNKKLEEAFLTQFRAAAKGNCKHTHEKAIFETFKELSPYQQENTQTLISNDELTIVFPLSENPFSDIDEICPLLKSDDNKMETIQKISAHMDKRRKNLESKHLSYLNTTKELVPLKDWIYKLRKEKQVYIIPAYHESSVFCLVASIHRDMFPPRNAQGAPMEPTDAEEKSNLSKLLKIYNESKPFANLTLVLSPRDAKDAINVPPINQLRAGTNSSTLGGMIKLGKNVNPTIGLLELVKWIP